MSPRLLRTLGFVLVAAIFVVVLAVLQRELRHVDTGEILAHVRATSPWALAGALVFTALSYLVLTLYDFLGLRYAKRPLPYRKTAFASFISYVFSHNLGLAMFGGLAFRYRIYSSWDLTAVDVARVAVFCGATFWLGLLTLGGFVFLAWPPPPLAFLPVPAWGYRLLGAGFLLLAGLYVLLCWRGVGRLRIRRWEFTLPSGRLAVLQAGAASLDWVLASTTLYLLFPEGLPIPYHHFLSLYVLAAVAGLIAHVPAGLGVIETVMIATLADAASAGTVLGTMLVYRAVYYLAPLVLAVVWMGAYELANATGVLRGATLAARRWFDALLPRIQSILVFGAGAALLLVATASSAGAAAAWQALAGLVAAGLLLVARGLQKRLDQAFVLARWLLLAGVGVALGDGLGAFVAAPLGAVLLLLAPCRPYFYRRASLLDVRLGPGWILALALTLVSMLWLGAWTSGWTQPPPVTALAGLAVVVLGAAAPVLPKARQRPVGRAPGSDPATDAAVAAILAQAARPTAPTGLRGDASLLLDRSRRAFVQYRVEGRSWIAEGDPVGAPEACRELVWAFRDLADHYGGWPVFQGLAAANLHFYAEAGFSLLQTGDTYLASPAGRVLPAVLADVARLNGAASSPSPPP